MDEVKVAKRIRQRHPELSEDDVRAAWNNTIRWSVRPQRNDEYVAVGFDNSGRLIEMVALRLSIDSWFIYHAQTPPTQRTFKELKMISDERREKWQ